MKPRHLSARALQAFTDAGLPSGLHVVAAKDSGPAEILVYDVIGADPWGGGLSATAFVAALASVGGGPVNIRINSPGGSVFDGMAMYNALLAHPGTVTCYVDGVAASAASFLACAGAKTIMGEASMMMIHNGRTIEVGDRHAMTATADLLGKVDAQLAAIYATKTGKPAAEFSALMDAETWFTAPEAVAAGLADETVAAPAKKTTKAKHEPAVKAEDDAAAVTAVTAAEARKKMLRVLRIAETQ